MSKPAGVSPPCIPVIGMVLVNVPGFVKLKLTSWLFVVTPTSVATGGLA